MKTNNIYPGPHDLVQQKGSRFRCIVLLRLLFRFFLSSIVKYVLLLLHPLTQAMSIVRGCTGECWNKIISLKLFLCKLNVVGMVCWTNSCQKKNHGNPSVTGQNTLISFRCLNKLVFLRHFVISKLLLCILGINIHALFKCMAWRCMQSIET